MIELNVESTKSLEWLNEAKTAEEREERLIRLMGIYSNRIKDFKERDSRWWVDRMLVDLREQEVDRLRILEIDLNAKEATLIEREEKLAALCRSLGIPVTIHSQINERDIVALHKKWRNYPKVAKKFGLQEHQVREVVLRWRKKARHKHQITAIFTKKHDFNDNDY